VSLEQGDQVISAADIWYAEKLKRGLAVCFQVLALYMVPASPQTKLKINLARGEVVLHHCAWR
jgi:hypothetical protein